MSGVAETFGRWQGRGPGARSAPSPPARPAEPSAQRRPRRMHAEPATAGVAYHHPAVMVDLV